MSDKVFEGLEPKNVWKHFAEILKIPRESKNEAKAAEYVEKVAKEKGCEIKRDDLGNVVVKVPATKGYEDKPIVVIQGHLDMVCEKNKSKEHDFAKDPITAVKEGDWITADDTTLGADNGIAIAAGLAIIEDEDAVHGPLELFFTVDEESGMSGVKKMSGTLLEGRTLLNLDSEEDGILYIGCAGGVDTKMSIDVKKEKAPEGYVPMLLNIGGLKGGHSGCDIHLGRGNAIKLLARALVYLGEKVKEADFRVASLDGGNKRNAIPRESEATLYLDPKAKGKMEEALKTLEDEWKIEFKIQEPGIALTLKEEGAKPGDVVAKEDYERIIQLLYTQPNGALQYSAAIEGLVETSTNLGVVHLEGNTVTSTSLTRSSLESAKASVAAQMRIIGNMIGAKVDQEAGYPGWNPNLDSNVLNKSKEVYKEMYGEEPEVKAIHAGLECAIIGGKVPGMDMISYGPTITGPHSPDEKLQISTVPKFYKYTKALLKALAS